MQQQIIDWKHATNIYEVNLRQFSEAGSFSAFGEALPRLKAMGVETLWFMPITPISKERIKGSLGSYYACSSYTTVNPEFGDLEDFKTLVRQAQQMGFKVILDWVANHTGWDHVWTRSHPDFFIKDSQTGTFKTASGMDDIIELNYDNPQLREAMIAAMKFWVTECNLDGFRCDLASWVRLDFWQEARPQLDALKPLFWLGEFDELENPEYGKVFDLSYSWKWMHKTEAFFREQQPLSELIELLMEYNKLGDTSMRAWFTSNHDENSWNGTEYEKYGPLARPLAVFSCTWNGVPIVYNGQEIPLVSKRLQFFDKDPIPWGSENALQIFYKTLLQLRVANPALRGGDPDVVTYLLRHSAPEKVLVYLRKKGSHEVLVLLNFSNSQALDLEIQDAAVSGIYQNVFSNVLIDFNLERQVRLSAYGYLVLEKRY